MNWLSSLLPGFSSKSSSKSNRIKECWVKCQSCGEVLYLPEFERNWKVCPKCNHHHRLDARSRIDQLLDEDSRVEIKSDLESVDRLKFRDSKKYKDRIAAAQKKTGETDAIIVTKGLMKNYPLVLAVMDFSYLGGSMGAVVGERFVSGVHAALKENIPFVCLSASGGARMQEGLISLMQMSKTSAALAKLGEAKLPYISVLTDPTTGGVTASFSMLGDIIVAEPKALIGFAGPRVIEQTVRETLPEGFQRSEFLLKVGAIDMIVQRNEMQDTLHRLLTKLKPH